MSTDVRVPQQLPVTQHAAPQGVKLPIYMDNHATCLLYTSGCPRSVPRTCKSKLKAGN